MATGKTCPACGHIHASADTYAVGRFSPNGVVGYRAAYSGALMRSTRDEAALDQGGARMTEFPLLCRSPYCRPPDELAALPISARARLFTEQTLASVYDYAEHVAVGELLADKGALPSDFMSLAPGSADPMVWHDIVRMRTLNTEQGRRGEEQHLCPLQLDIVERLIRRFSAAGDLVYDPFAGVGTVPLVALQMGRRGAGTELNPGYWADGCAYLREQEAKRSAPTLFDVITQAEDGAA